MSSNNNTNIHNYFAAFLHKRNQKSISIDSAITVDSSSVTPQRTLPTPQREQRPSGGSEATDGAARSPERPSPNAAQAAARAPPMMMGDDDDDVLLAPHPPAQAAQAVGAKRGRSADAERRRGDNEAVLETEDSQASYTAALDAIARGGRASQGSEDDYERQLAAVLGLEDPADGTRPVRSPAAPAPDARRDGGGGGGGGQWPQPRPREATPEAPRAAGGGQAVRALGWPAGRGTRRLAQIAERFAAQLKHELKSHAALFVDLEPFLRDRLVARLERDPPERHPRQFLPAPAELRAEELEAAPGCRLRDYQLAGVRFLLDHFHRALPCILADDMGLGKTAQVSSFLQALATLHGVRGPHLVVVPLSTLTGWVRELARWAPGLHVVKYHGERGARHEMRLHAHSVFVTTPAVFLGDRGFFRQRAWVCAVVDEAHVLKHSRTQISQLARKLTACFRVAVTGTPIQNDVSEVWSLMAFLYPAAVAGYDAAATKEDPVGAVRDCTRMLQHIMLRRTKGSLELGLPPRVDLPPELLRPTAMQAELLSQLTARALQEAESGGNAVLFAHLSRQRAVCNHPMAVRLLQAADAAARPTDPLETRLAAAGVPLDEAHVVAPSAKMVYLDALLPRLRAAGHRCLIFSNFTTTLDLLEALCRLRGFSYERLDGGSNRVERELAMLRYNSPQSSCFLFLVTTTAGGVGVTLTGADTVILYDSHFNPQMDQQAADRAHRLGQTREVRVHRLRLRGTVEEHIARIAQRKASIGHYIVDGGNTAAGSGGSSSGDGGAEESKQLTGDEIRELMLSLHDRTAGGGGGGGSPTTATHAEEEEGGAPPSTPCSQGARATALSPEAVEREVQALMSVIENGIRAPPRSDTRGENLASRPTTRVCFVCGEGMHPLEAMYHCCSCPKAYHADCVGERPPPEGKSGPRTWSCPRHACAACGKAQQADGALFLCESCPRSLCLECLPPRYLELADDGLQLRHVSRRYATMAADGAAEQRSYYYVTCMRCCGLEEPSSADSGGEEDEESDSSGSGGDGEEADDSGDDDVEEVFGA